MGMVSPWKDPECSLQLLISLLIYRPCEMIGTGLLSSHSTQERKDTGHRRSIPDHCHALLPCEETSQVTLRAFATLVFISMAYDSLDRCPSWVKLFKLNINLCSSISCSTRHQEGYIQVWCVDKQPQRCLWH